MKVIKIGAEWCPGCIIMRPRWAEIEKENPWLKTQYFDFDKDSQKLTPFNLQKASLPTFIFLDKNGDEFLRKEGEISKKELLKIISENKDK